LEEFGACWEGLEDPRTGNAALHEFHDLLMIALCTVLCSGQNATDMPAARGVPYLKLTGTVSGAWQMARAARIACQLLASGENNAAFLRAKIATARFYAEHVLPEAGTWRDEITVGAASTLALEEAALE